MSTEEKEEPMEYDPQQEAEKELIEQLEYEEYAKAMLMDSLWNT